MPSYLEQRLVEGVWTGHDTIDAKSRRQAMIKTRKTDAIDKDGKPKKPFVQRKVRKA